MAASDASSGQTPLPAGGHVLSSTASSATPAFTTVTVQNIFGMIPIKLQANNYLLWKNLFLPILRKFKMLGLVTGDEPSHPRTFLILLVPPLRIQPLIFGMIKIKA